MLLDESPRSVSHSPFQHHEHYEHEQQQFLLSPKGYTKSNKRRLSNSSPTSKRIKPEQALRQSTPKKHSYPMFEHPGGDGLLQQTPYGVLKITKKGRIETTVLDKSITLASFSQSYTKPDENKQYKQTHRIQQSFNQSHQNEVSVRGVLSPSPSAEIEGYMMEGYEFRNPEGTNKSYRYHEEEILNVNYGLYDADYNECDFDKSNEIKENNDTESMDCEIY